MKCHISSRLINELIGPDGTANLLTQISIHEIIGKGIPFVRSITNEGEEVHQMNSFWDYFIDTWLKKYDPKTWNVKAIDDEETVEVVNRTNNPLERYNRQLNEKFAHVTPSMDEFINVIRSSLSLTHADPLPT